MLLPHVERLAAQGATVDSRAAELRDGSAGLLSLASPSNFAGVVLPAAVAAFVRERPRVQIEVNAYVRREEVVRQLQQERADLGFLYAPIEEPGFAVEPIMEARMVCVLPQASPLAELSEVSPNDSCQREWSSPRPAARQGNRWASTWPNSVCDWSMSLRRISRTLRWDWCAKA